MAVARYEVRMLSQQSSVEIWPRSSTRIYVPKVIFRYDSLYELDLHRNTFMTASSSNVIVDSDNQVAKKVESASIPLLVQTCAIGHA